MSDEWGDWHAHDGNRCPLPDGTYVQAVEADDGSFEGIVEKRPTRFGEVNVWDWADCAAQSVWEYRVIAYRIRKPRGLVILETLLADLPAPARPEVDA